MIKPVQKKSLMIKTYWLVTLLLLLSFSGQAQTNDARLWSRFTLEKNLSKHFALEGNVGVRIGQNYTSMEIYYFSLGGKYKLNKHWSCDFFYRYSGKRMISDRFEIRNRVQFCLMYKTKVANFMTTKFYLQYQKQYVDLYRSEEGKIAHDYLRGKFTFTFETHKKYKPYISSELFYQLKYDKNEFNRVRYEAGIKYEINKHHSYELFYMMQREFNEPNPTRSYIIGIYYTISI